MKTKILLIALATLMLLTVFAGCAENKNTDEPNATESVPTEDSEEPVKTQEIEIEKSEPYPGELTSILLMGSMQGDFSDENNQNYALTHILITIDPQTRTLRFTTFPYNLMVEPVLDEEAEPTQLQFLYSSYGADVVVDTLSQNFGIEIDEWVIMNMHAVKQIVDELGGLEIDVPELTVNEMAETVEMLLGYIWEEVVEEGKQILSGIQITGFFMDTYHDLDEENPLKDEELRFRERHEDIIDALIIGIKALKLDEMQLVDIAMQLEGSYLTSMKEKDWQEIAKMALACAENEHMYLHVPEIIEFADDEWSMIYDEVDDVNAVIQFVTGK